MSFEKDYLALGKEILRDGEVVEGRNGITKQLFGTVLKFDLQKEFPILTTRKSFYKSVLGEFSALMNAPFDNVQHMKDFGVNYWELWSNPETGALKVDYGNEGERVLNTQGDTQMSEIIRMLKEDPHSRRIILNYWNPDNVCYTDNFKPEVKNNADYTHKLFKTWEGENTRCYNTNDKDFKNYGGRGITVSDEFKDFNTWLSYVESLPDCSADKVTLDRIDNDKGYERNNLRWISSHLQVLNSRMNSNNSSGFTGVDKIKNKYRARIMNNDKKVVIGNSFETSEDAAIARDEYIIKNDLDHRLSTLSNDIRQGPTKLSLHCCWYSLQFHVREDKYLDIIWNQRSADWALGVQADAMLAAAFILVIANQVGLSPGKAVMNFGNSHLYKEHWDKFAEQAKREPLKSPDYTFKTVKGMQYKDFRKDMIEIHNYNHLEPIKFELKA